MQTTTTAPNRAERLTWLLDLLVPQQYAELQESLRGPLTADQLALLDRFITELEQMHPVRTAVMAATEDELPAVIDRILAEASR